MDTPREQLAELLRRSRIDAGYRSHGALAADMHVSRPVVSRAENPTNPVPSDDVLVGWSGCTGVALDRLMDLAGRAKSGTPDWFVPYRQAESEATTLRSWAPMIFPGLLQTEAYARAVLSAEPRTPAKLAELLRARIERQAVLQRAFYTVLIGADVLSRCMGDAQVMADQLAHVTEVAELPNVTVHVVPADANHGAWGGLDIASRDGLATVAFTTATTDVTTTSTPRVDEALRTYERCLGYALPAPASLDHVRDWEAQWKQKI